MRLENVMQQILLTMEWHQMSNMLNLPHAQLRVELNESCHVLSKIIRSNRLNRGEMR